MKHPSIKLLPLLLLCISTLSHSHENIQKQSHLTANAHLNFATKSSSDPTQIWQVPGTFMGGEALPLEKGFEINDIVLSGLWYAHYDYFVETRISSHHGSEIELENVTFSLPLNRKQLFSFGKMDAQFSPISNWHGYIDNFNEAPLSSDIIFGGHFTDTGLRYTFQHAGIILGTEIWNGYNWPASPNEYSGDIYAHYLMSNEHFSAKFGLWSYFAKADSRTDTRYENGHNHEVSNQVNNNLAFYFTGESEVSGAFSDLQLIRDKNTSLGLYSELIYKKVVGVINDTSRQSDYSANHHAYINKLYLRNGTWTYALRHEELSFENDFNGVAALIIAQETNLNNPGFEPSRSHLSIAKVINAFTVRLELVADNALNKSVNRGTLALIWKETLWKSE